MSVASGQFDTLRVLETTARAYVSANVGTSSWVVLLHPWWGLNDDAVAYADRLMGAGFGVVAPDLFGGRVASTIEGAKQLIGAVDIAMVDAIVLAAIDDLRHRVPHTTTVATVGFSFGAHWAMWAASQLDCVAATVLYYGTPDRAVLTATKVPVLGHFAKVDPYETAEAVAEFEAALRSAGRDASIHRYPGTSHWFAEPSRDAYVANQANLAFERTVSFLDTHLGAGH